ncbi:MAG: dephospho-CoA kinase [Bdellovibrionales bacterium]|nr:dephospho-CoA kinase [Bdellovibrionales bacterium]
MLWIGLTGGIGTGKSSVASFFRDLGVTVIDADEISRRVTGPGSQGEARILKEFGDRLSSKSVLDRKELRELVFKDRILLKKLEKIVHPLVQSETQRKREAAERAGEPYSIYDVPLLFEAHLEAQFDKIIVVSAPFETQIQRVMDRDKVSRDSVVQTIKSQMDMEKKKKRADFILENSGNLENLRQKVTDIHLVLLNHQPHE